MNVRTVEYKFFAFVQHLRKFAKNFPNMRIENISISDIVLGTPGWDRFFFTCPASPGKLTASLQSAELQQPVTLAAFDNRYYIVLGVKRVLAYRQLGRSEIPSIIRRTDSEEELLWMSLYEKTATAPLNAMEKSKAIVRFCELWQNDLATVREKICRLIDLPPTIESIEMHLFLTRLPPYLQTRLAAGELTPAHVALLSSFRRDELDPVAEAFFVKCQPTMQEAREMIENLAGLSVREDCRPSELLVSGSMMALLNDSALSVRERTARVREWLHTRRFPRLSKTEIEFRALVVPIEKKSGISIHPPRGFEGEACQVSIKLSNEAEVEKMAGALRQSLDDKTWEKIFKLLRDGL